DRSDRFIAAARQRSAPRIDSAPTRRPIPQDWSLDLQTSLQGIVVYLRRTDDRGIVQLLGHQFLVDPGWTHRLVRTELDLTRQRIRFYALRRHHPNHQRLIRSFPYRPPQKQFLE